MVLHGWWAVVWGHVMVPSWREELRVIGDMMYDFTDLFLHIGLVLQAVPGCHFFPVP